jgi:SNF2 family DNA or RNA helicase
LVPLLEGGFARLPSDWLERNAALLERLLQACANRESAIPKYVLPALVELHDVLNTPLTRELLPIKRLLTARGDEEQFTLPSDLCVELRPYQLQGARWLIGMRELGLGATLADDMGLGKTAQAICAIAGKTLVVCPTSLLTNWEREIARFRPGLTTFVYHGEDRALSTEASVTLTTYALLRRDAEILCRTAWDVVILDEAQAIKNPESQVAQSACQLNAQFRLTLTGTPIENRLDELWSQLHFTNPGLLGSRNEFAQKYVELNHDAAGNAAEKLRSIIGPFVLHRRKQLVAPELPPKTEREIYFELHADERELYQNLHALAQRDILPQLAQGQNTLGALEALLRLRQAACHPGLLPGHTAATSSKIELLVEELELVAAEGQRALVFSQWTSFLDLVEPHLQHAGISALRLDGSTKDRGSVVDQFQREDGPPVLLLSLKAGGTGLNLTAADHVFLMDLWWNPAVEAQAADRVHRIGQTRPVFVHRLVARGTVEERILLLHAHKRAISTAILEDTARAAELTREDLIELLS